MGPSSCKTRRAEKGSQKKKKKDRQDLVGSYRLYEIAILASLVSLSLERGNGPLGSDFCVIVSHSFNWCLSVHGRAQTEINALWNNVQFDFDRSVFPGFKLIVVTFKSAQGSEIFVDRSGFCSGQFEEGGSV